MLWWTYQQLRMGNAKSRLAVVEKLGVSGDEEAVGPLVFSLKDKEAAVRCAAVKALMRFQDPRAVEPLMQLLQDPEPQTRAAAAEALGQLGDRVAVSRLVGSLRDADPAVRTLAARSLNRLGWKPGTESQRVLQVLATGNLQQLAALGAEGVTPLLELLHKGPPNRQLSAVKTLGEINDPRVRPAMVEALRIPNPAVRIAALGTLERLSDPAAYPEVEKLLRDNDASVRGAAVEAAVRCGGPRAVPALVKCLKDSSWEVRQMAVNALGFVGDRSAVDGLCSLLNDPDRDVRESVIAALGQLADRRALVPLVLALLDVESSVRTAATAMLNKLDRQWSQNEAVRALVPQIVLASNHPDYWVRYHAGKLLERLNASPDPGAAQPRAATPEMPARVATLPHPAIGILSEMLFDRDRDFRLAAADALGRLREKNTGGLLTAALQDADFSVRQAARTALAALN